MVNWKVLSVQGGQRSRYLVDGALKMRKWTPERIGVGGFDASDPSEKHHVDGVGVPSVPVLFSRPRALGRIIGDQVAEDHQ